MKTNILYDRILWLAFVIVALSVGAAIPVVADWLEPVTVAFLAVATLVVGACVGVWFYLREVGL